MNVQATAKAINDSKYMLVYVNEAYRKSFICQAQAKYASFIQKPIIPLIMANSDRKISGWVASIVNTSKECVNFDKNCIEHHIEELNKLIAK